MNEKKTISITLRVSSLNVPDDFPEDVKQTAVLLSRKDDRGAEVYLARVQFPEDRVDLLRGLNSWAEKHNVRMDARFRLYEWGLGSRFQGGAQVVCSLRGEPMGSVGGSPKSDAPNAIFWCQRALLVTFEHQGSWQNGSVRLLELDPSKGIESTLLWNFEVSSEEEFTLHDFNESVAKDRGIDFPDDAAEAVFEKSHRKSGGVIYARRNDDRRSRRSNGTSNGEGHRVPHRNGHSEGS